RLGYLNLDGAWLAFMGYAWTPWIFTLLALIELITDQLPSTPSRKTPPQFGVRLLSGALSGATLGASGGSSWIVGLIAGVATAFGRDRPAALIEDAGAIILGLVIVLALR